MKTSWPSAVVVCLLAGLQPGTARAEPSPSRPDAGTEVRRVFAAKCAGCHGADLPKPKGRFGYVLDLRRLRDNPEMVVRSRPDESELWVLVRRDEMPPGDSPYGPLTAEQKETVRAWIAAGAPDAADPGPVSPGDIPAPAAARAPAATADRLVGWLGKFHLLLIHFPIALGLAAFAGEMWSLRQRQPIPPGAVRYCLWLGAVLAVPAAGLGWLFAAAGNGVGSPRLLTAHRWLGTSAAALLAVAAVGAERDVRRGRRSRSVRLLMLCCVLLTTVAAHFGGLLSRGSDFFDL